MLLEEAKEILKKNGYRLSEARDSYNATKCMALFYRAAQNAGFDVSKENGKTVLANNFKIEFEHNGVNIYIYRDDLGYYTFWHDPEDPRHGYDGSIEPGDTDESIARHLIEIVDAGVTGYLEN